MIFEHKRRSTIDFAKKRASISGNLKAKRKSQFVTSFELKSVENSPAKTRKSIHQQRLSKINTRINTKFIQNEAYKEFFSSLIENNINNEEEVEHNKLKNNKRIYESIEDNRPNPYFLEVVNLEEIEKLKVDKNNNSFPLLLRYFISIKYYLKLVFLSVLIFLKLYYRLFQKLLKNAVTSNFFDSLSLLVIFLNCLTFVIEISHSSSYTNYKKYAFVANNFFSFFYLTEISLKIISLNLIQFLKDFWNFFDFLLLIFLIIDFFIQNQNLDFIALRTLRLMRPLRTMKYIKNLKIIVNAILSEIPQLFEIIILMLFVFSLFSGIGLIFFSGVLKYKCIYISFGIEDDKIQLFCGNLNCKKNFLECAKTIENRYGDVRSFDNFFSSLFQVFRISTLDSWTQLMYENQKNFTNFSSIYFIFLVIGGNFFLLNLTLAVIKVILTKKK